MNSPRVGAIPRPGMDGGVGGEEGREHRGEERSDLHAQEAKERRARAAAEAVSGGSAAPPGPPKAPRGGGRLAAIFAPRLRARMPQPPSTVGAKYQRSAGATSDSVETLGSLSGGRRRRRRR